MESTTDIGIEGEYYNEEYDEIFNSEEIFNNVFNLTTPWGGQPSASPEFTSIYGNTAWEAFQRMREKWGDQYSNQEILNKMVEDGYLQDTTLEE